MKTLFVVQPRVSIVLKHVGVFKVKGKFSKTKIHTKCNLLHTRTNLVDEIRFLGTEYVNPHGQNVAWP